MNFAHNAVRMCLLDQKLVQMDPGTRFPAESLLVARQWRSFGMEGSTGRSSNSGSYLPRLWLTHALALLAHLAHATLKGSAEEKNWLKSSKGSPTYLLRQVCDAHHLEAKKIGESKQGGALVRLKISAVRRIP